MSNAGPRRELKTRKSANWREELRSDQWDGAPFRWHRTGGTRTPETDFWPLLTAGAAAACRGLTAFSTPNAKSDLLQRGEVELIKFLFNYNKETACAIVASDEKHVAVTKLKLYPVNLSSM